VYVAVAVQRETFMRRISLSLSAILVPLTFSKLFHKRLEFGEKVKVKAKVFHYKPDVVLGVPGG
jgi:hypothetical protein